LISLLFLVIFTKASLQDIILDIPYSVSQTSRSFPDFTLARHEEHSEARWHIHWGILEALRGIKEQEAVLPVNRKLGVETALQHFKVASQVEPNNNWIVLNTGLIRLREGLYTAAMASFEYIIHNTKNSLLMDKAYQYLGYAHEFNGQIKDAEYYYNLVKLGTQIPYDDHEPKHFYSRSPRHEYTDYREYLCDIVVFYELYEQYLNYIEDLGGEDEFRPSREVDERNGYYYIHGGRVDVGNAANWFIIHDYVVLQSFIHPIEVKICQRWYRHLRVLAMLKSFDIHLQRYTGHNDRISYYYHGRYLNLHSRLAKKLLKPAYSYVSYYMPIKDAQTPRPWLQGHTDRDDNEYTSSIQVLNVDQDGNKAQSWPIWIVTNATNPAFASWRSPPQNNIGAVELHQENGDCILFRGRQHIHYRENMPKDTTETLTFLLHYVDGDFDMHEYKVTRAGRDRNSPGVTTGY